MYHFQVKMSGSHGTFQVCCIHSVAPYVFDSHALNLAQIETKPWLGDMLHKILRANYQKENLQSLWKCLWSMHHGYVPIWRICLMFGTNATRRVVWKFLVSAVLLHTNLKDLPHVWRQYIRWRHRVLHVMFKSIDQRLRSHQSSQIFKSVIW